MLSASQLASLAALGEQRTARVGDVLYHVGDRVYPFVAILQGEVAIGAAGQEIMRYRAGNFLGELNLLTGQTVLLSAIVTKALRYVAAERDTLRSLLFEDGPLSDLVLPTFGVDIRAVMATVTSDRPGASADASAAAPRHSRWS